MRPPVQSTCLFCTNHTSRECPGLARTCGHSKSDHKDTWGRPGIPDDVFRDPSLTVRESVTILHSKQSSKQSHAKQTFNGGSGAATQVSIQLSIQLTVTVALRATMTQRSIQLTVTGALPARMTQRSIRLSVNYN